MVDENIANSKPSSQNHIISLVIRVCIGTTHRGCTDIFRVVVVIGLSVITVRLVTIRIEGTYIIPSLSCTSYAFGLLWS